MLMPASGPMPGSMPTSVPTRQPRNAYHSTSGRNAMEKPSSRLSTVASTLKPEQAARQRRFEQGPEQQVGGERHADAEEGGAHEALPLDRDQEAEQQQRHGDAKAEHRVERGGGRGGDEDAERMREV